MISTVTPQSFSFICFKHRISSQDEIPIPIPIPRVENPCNCTFLLYKWREIRKIYATRTALFLSISLCLSLSLSLSLPPLSVCLSVCLSLSLSLSLSLHHSSSFQVVSELDTQHESETNNTENFYCNADCCISNG